MIVNTGELNRRVLLQLRNETKDSFGGIKKNYVDYKSVWAKVDPFTSGEMVRSGQDLEKLLYRILIRYDSKIDHNGRIIHDNKTLEIKSVINLKSENRYIQMICEEIR
jgi:SPP1 family predicted phage head-tail adaptor